MAQAKEPWPIRRLLEWTETFFKSKNQANPRLETQILLAHALGCKKIDLYVRLEEEPSEEVRTKFRESIKKRVEGCPVAYLVGYREFFSLAFDVGPEVLIPRPETELILTEGKAALKAKPNAKILDLGTGSGNIAITFAVTMKQVQVTAVDISPAALETARKNAIKHSVMDRVRFFEGDLFDPIPSGEQFDLIVSNPPYISRPEMAQLPVEIAKYEPHTALDGGEDGLDFYRRIAASARPFLAEKGTLMLEIGSTQAESVAAILVSAGFADVKVIVDLARLPRVVLAR